MNPQDIEELKRTEAGKKALWLIESLRSDVDFAWSDCHDEQCGACSKCVRRVEAERDYWRGEAARLEREAETQYQAMLDEV